MIDPRICRTPFAEFRHLTWKEITEYERLAGCLRLTGRNAVRYVWLFERKYFPPGDTEARGDAA